MIQKCKIVRLGGGALSCKNGESSREREWNRSQIVKGLEKRKKATDGQEPDLSA